ncbi:CoA ester lyase [Variovorax sp. UMC13]|uniref:HpcH/HpaI aldolase/citrate lyase family protein n=1 Tax=Variovorax sp. UMC13 TaxID=1862326 RepID=UPI00160369B7|nr:CoA ester lyase [Variovorax sp. UMC13]MBB1603771.1 aldolase [Variovorax sp. UMC13]
MNACSYLFVPGNRPERFDKAMASGADAVVLDLEDAVPDADKPTARASVAQWLRARRAGAAVGTSIVVRLNAYDTPWHAADVQACAMGAPALMLPKAEQPAHLTALGLALPGCALLPLIESANGIAASLAIARAPGVQRLVFGSIDFQLDLGIDGEDEELLFFRSQLVLHSRLAGIASPVDGVSTALDDAARVYAESSRSRRLGFGAKLCIHPRQVAAVHAAFAPTTAQIDSARRTLAAAAAAGGAAVALDGAMVDRPVILRAEALLARARLSSSIQ